MIEIVHGDCLDVFRGRSCLGAIVSDLPSGTGFMGRGWDKDRGGRAAWIAYWAERLSVAREACAEDAVGLFWALPRTQHWTATAVEDAGWRIQDVIVHVFGQGWPKSSTALKPAQEMWILARKGSPDLGIDDCRVARGSRVLIGAEQSNGAGLFGLGGRGAIGETTLGSWPTNFVMSHAEGCCRAGMRKVRGEKPRTINGDPNKYSGGGRPYSVDLRTGNPDGTETLEAWACVAACDCGAAWLAMAGGSAPRCECGRPGWWACPIAEMDAQSGTLKSGTVEAHHRRGARVGKTYGNDSGGDFGKQFGGDEGGASRFFPTFGYYAKAPAGERHAGCEDLYWRADREDPFGWAQITRAEYEATSERETSKSGSSALNGRMDSRGGPLLAVGNVHPTVKRLALMRWLHKLAAPKGPIGDLCAGSGSGAIAAFLDGHDWVGADVCQQAIVIANARLAFWRNLTPEARARFIAFNEMPQRPEADPRQGSLFATMSAL